MSTHADDTEVFFSEAHGTTLSNSNILFVLDNSGSMGYDNGDIWRWGADYSTPIDYPAFPNRMSDLQATMNTLLEGIENVNIGIMTFTYDCLPSDADCTTRDNYAQLIHNIVDVDAAGNRATLQQSVAAMLPRTNTPITAALYEAAMAITGGPMGRQAGNYPDPMLSECQQNHIVVLSDGIANADVPKAEIESVISPATCGVGVATGEYCGVEVARWLNETDHRPASTDLNSVTVHTIGFAINTPFLSDLASVGGGGYKQASTSAELLTVFEEILLEVKDVDTTFVAPVSSTDSLNRLSQSDDLYFGMFTPSLTTQWDGNLKRYKLDMDDQGNVVIMDGSTPPKNAISDITGFFADDAKSIWSSSADGADVTKGGAASKITHANRNVYTYIGSPLSPTTNASPVHLPSNGTSSAPTALHKDNPNITQAQLGVTSGIERDSLLDWARGVDTDDQYDDATDVSDSRTHIGDILHSTPVSIKYDDANGPLIFFGTNEGFLHAINSNDGTEEYSFIPEELLANLKVFRENSRDNPHLYGLDGSITFHHLDKASVSASDSDGDGLVNNGETAMLYVGMRRGGRNYYGFDVSSRSNPKLNWQIIGGTGDFTALGQSWSKPTPARIRYQGNIKHVLIFGGGYDENQDPTNEANLTQTQSTDVMGNAIYIVDAGTGALLWKADSTSFSDMDYSIPSDIRILDIDANGLADRLYVGDMGGQLWRFDINSGHQASDSSNTLVSGGVMAQLGGNDTIDNARRFYSKPDVALISKEGQHFMSVSIGSGWRAHPRNLNVNDRFYMIRDNRPLDRITDSNNFGAVRTSPTATTWRPVTEADLRDVTLAIDTLPAPDQEGWMLRLNDAAGEKSLSSSLTINNQIIFPTYAPEEPQDECEPAGDSSQVYVVDVLRGNPVLPLAGGGDTLTSDDRKKNVAINGIPPAPSAVIKENADGSFSTGVLLGTKPILKDLEFSELTKRTYWHDRHRGPSTPDVLQSLQCGNSTAPGESQAAHSGIRPPDSCSN